MITDVIEVRQLPIIAERLAEIKAEIEAQTTAALALDCTEDTVKDIKKVRASLNKVLTNYESKRKEVKSQILAPYEAFETIYKDCISTPLKEADKLLADRINDVEFTLKAQRTEELKQFYCEYRESVGLSEADAPFEKSGINVTLSVSMKALKSAAEGHLDGIVSDLSLISSMEHADEILAEYRICGTASHAILTVKNRYKAVEEERKRREEREVREAEAKKAEEAVKAAETAQDAALKAPTVTDNDEKEKLYTVRFTVKAPLDKLKELKRFLAEGGYKYE